MEYIILEDSKGKIRRNKEEKDEGIMAKIEKERKTMQLTAGVCSPVLVSLFSLVSTPSFSSRSHPGRSSRHSLGSFFVLSHSPRSGEHELPYSDVTSEDQLKQMMPTCARAAAI